MQTVFFQQNFESEQKNCTNIFEGSIKIFDGSVLGIDGTGSL